MTVWFLLVFSIVLLLRETRKHFFLFYMQNRQTLTLILNYFLTIQIVRLVQIIVAVEQYSDDRR